MPSWNKTYNFVDFAITFHPPIRLTYKTLPRNKWEKKLQSRSWGHKLQIMLVVYG